MDFEVTYRPDRETAEKAYNISGGKTAEVMSFVRLIAAVMIAIVFVIAFVKNREILNLILSIVAAALCVAELNIAEKFKNEKIQNCCEGEEITVRVSEKELEFIYPTGKEVRAFKKMKKIVKKDGIYAFRFKDETDFRYIPEDDLDEENKAQLEELLKGVSCYKAI